MAFADKSHQTKRWDSKCVKCQCPRWKLCKIFIGNKIVYCHCQTQYNIEVPKRPFVLLPYFVVLSLLVYRRCRHRHCWFLHGVFWFIQNLIMHRWTFCVPSMCCWAIVAVMHIPKHTLTQNTNRRVTPKIWVNGKILFRFTVRKWLVRVPPNTQKSRQLWNFNRKFHLSCQNYYKRKCIHLWHHQGTH